MLRCKLLFQCMSYRRRPTFSFCFFLMESYETICLLVQINNADGSYIFETEEMQNSFVVAQHD
jgi:hypothetical protein